MDRHPAAPGPAVADGRPPAPDPTPAPATPAPVPPAAGGRTPRPGRRLAAAQAVWALGYLAAAVLGGLTRLPSPPVAFVWPAAGVAVLWFVLTPPRYRLRVAMPLLLGLAFVANLATQAPALVSAAFALANVAHAVVGGTVFLRLARRTPDTLRDGHGLLALGAASAAGAVAGAPVLLAVLGPQGLAGALEIVLLWVPRFAASTAVVMALVLAWRAARADAGAAAAAGTAPRGRRPLEVALVLPAALAVNTVVYARQDEDAFAFLVLPVTVLVGWRLGPAWTATYGALTAALGVVATLQGYGPFSTVRPVTTQTLVVQAFIAVTGLVGLALSIEVVQRRLALEASDRRGDVLARTLEAAVVPNALLVLAPPAAGTVRYANPAMERWWSDDGGGGTVVGRRWPDLLDPAEHAGFAAVLADLATGRVGSWEGQLVHRTRSGERRTCLLVAAALHDEGPAGQPERVANVQLVDVTERTDLEARLAHQAMHDALTGLPNRVLLLDRIAQALAAAPRAGGAVAVLFLDLDHFKRVNDSLGHAVGDQVLAEVATRLVRAVRPGDTVARLGGDEFVVCCPAVADRAAGAALAARVLREVCRPVTVDGREVGVGASVGMTLARAGTDPGDLLREADTAMYEAKVDGRGRAAFFSERLFDRVRLDLELDGELRAAVAERAFVLHVQPLVEIATGRVTAVEALLRWQHPRRGLLLPGAWLDVAETSGLMPRLGAWALDAALAGWPRVARRHGEHVRVHVNVSAAQLRDGGFGGVVEAALARTGTPPDRVVLELTETHLLTVHDALVAELDRIRSLGVRLSVDDFGTGYSSLTQLTALPVDEVKIDRSFVAAMTTDPRSRAVVEGVVAMARAMQLDVVGEGVETREVARALADAGCRVAQGYLWGRPAPLGEDPEEG
ncbi:EAL domain-containing protein [Cellulomonas endophytica]|uniref:bifunctional diguanylate cyclase/phosphodiesterase n=1 Tax=Cellulomonas endophytica TaxID=2494735 RepID=UPI0013E9482C|nr:EAL domain-containing protein [Cellulomonas endophytica]